MKKLSLLSMISLFMLLSCNTEVVIDKEAETIAIQQVVESFFVALGDFDAEKMKPYTTEDFLAFDMAKIMNFDGLVNALLEFKEAGMSDIVFVIEPVKTDFFGNGAHFCYKNSATGKMGDQDIKIDFIESCLFEKGDEGWKIKFLHSTEVPPPAPES